MKRRQRGFQLGGGRGRKRAGWCRRAPPCRRRACSVSFSREPMQVGDRTRPGGEAGLADDLVHGAVRQQLAVGDVGDLVAALGLVHVVRGDEHGQALGGEVVDLVPELAPGLGIDAGRRLVEQQQVGLGQDAGAERQALLPAARQLAGELQPRGRRAPAARWRRVRWPADRAGRTRAPRTPGSRGSTGPDRARSAASCSRRAA